VPDRARKGGHLDRIRLTALLVLTALLPPRAAAQFPPAPGTGPGLAETIEAIDAARVTTRILYVTAHPDDESGAVLTYLARGLHADVALLSLTRGEGGQNVLGPEQAPQLGLIRTQELLAATRGYGVKLYFTRAKDFGYSKTPEETMKVWGDQVLEDMVRVLRTFRPNIVINGWGGVHSGHGHHQAAGILTPKAVAAAADRSFCGDCGPAWKVEQILDLEHGSEKPAGYVLPLDEVAPLWGKSWRELGLDAFVNHRTQGMSAFINSPFLRRTIALKREDGGVFDPYSLATLLDSTAEKKESWSPDCEGLFWRIDEQLVKARSSALALDWKSTTNSLATANDYERLKSTYCPYPSFQRPNGSFVGLPGDNDMSVRGRTERALELALGLSVTADADKAELVDGESFLTKVDAHCRPELNCRLDKADLDFRGPRQEVKREGDLSKGLRFMTVASPATTSVDVELSVGDHHMGFNTPITHVQVSSTRVDRVPLRVVPAYTLVVEPRQEIELLAKQRKPFDVLLRVHSYSTQSSKVSIGLDVPQGWTSSAPVTAEFAGVSDQYVKLTVTPPAKLDAGNFTITAYAKRGEEKFTTSLEPLPSMPTLLWEEPAQTVVHAFDINVPENLHVGYITAESEPVPDSLKMLGIQVDLLDANALAFSDLSHFDAIVVGVRAYELRSELPGANQRLLDYLQNGGTLVVQYQRDFAWDKFQYAPYPAKMDSGKPGDPLPRITDENAEVKFLKPDDALLNRPNKITPADFQNWIQERGLYFWTDFDAKYTPLLTMHDPGEKDLNGALVYTHLGKGTYIYTGLAFFRQLPEGVPGAYHLFIN